MRFLFLSSRESSTAMTSFKIKQDLNKSTVYTEWHDTKDASFAGKNEIARCRTESEMYVNVYLLMITVDVTRNAFIERLL